MKYYSEMAQLVDTRDSVLSQIEDIVESEKLDQLVQSLKQVPPPFGRP
eukprot:CAMPEP_0170484404 /NCGR_PEP_ID=MMETSP0208-20121228/3876_1 /TAXON_ID=197538 /ORGANISM="Strombidium inclinatum, Strain S3" /LENGTH=47 /DNA_ID= /DNA_START= /DNA_END= /DNA_ORIENTATION=